MLCVRRLLAIQCTEGFSLTHTLNTAEGLMNGQALELYPAVVEEQQHNAQPIRNTAAANETSKEQLEPCYELQLKDTDKGDTLYATPKIFSTLTQQTVETASSDTVNSIDNQEKVSTVSSKESYTKIDYACKALEQSSFSYTAIVDMAIGWCKYGNFIEEEIEKAMDISSSLEGKEKEGDDGEESGIECNNSRDVYAQDERGTLEERKAEDKKLGNWTRSNPIKMSFLFECFFMLLLGSIIVRCLGNDAKCSTVFDFFLNNKH
ncbi:hypothetical protein NDU88_004965 [Pleurodeles waltl]|uniref:Uncharacterized protein n=1 Tax=Pleurodeles waltl TaxID=8319 RepID=A0AAV7RMF7_PLEWA|nr:hypothetical protein NDU88_004965 [Pleurodeles waltl]